ncbi:hypothetical protein BO99DRAFT_27752 [Aspergillus violaceofuscus CBS 115571]|uniref:Uncharacterized protein n=1 Tax=Aspergillus violaceofuscus (strain CBS 115571) TaxID=1450538 RepID=A0A2V5HE60_ASPV1|nr:hypothetical protein BO99DRAFT_27752 [Aspergillus violaceofuscus CBS 115571]
MKENFQCNNRIESIGRSLLALGSMYCTVHCSSLRLQLQLKCLGLLCVFFWVVKTVPVSHRSDTSYLSGGSCSAPGREALVGCGLALHASERPLCSRQACRLRRRGKERAS